MVEGLYRRKVQVVGGSTFVVSIPKQWAEEIGIYEGSEVAVEKLSDGSIKIFPITEKPRELPSSRLFFSCSEGDDVIARTILAFYLSGTKEIRIVASDVACKEKILKVISFLKNKVLGLEVIEELSTELVLGVIVDFKFSTLLSAQQKMIKTIRSMLEDITSSISSRNTGILGDIYKRDDLLDRLYLYSLRYITAITTTSETQEKIPPQLLPHYALIAKSLERIGDHVSAIAKNLTEALEKKEIEDEQLEGLGAFLSEGKSVLDMIVELSEKFNYQVLIQATEKAISLLKKEGELRKGLSRSSLTYSYIVESCRRIAAYSIDVLESMLDIAALEHADLFEAPKSKS